MTHICVDCRNCGNPFLIGDLYDRRSRTFEGPSLAVAALRKYEIWEQATQIHNSLFANLLANRLSPGSLPVDMMPKSIPGMCPSCDRVYLYSSRDLFVSMEQGIPEAKVC